MSSVLISCDEGGFTGPNLLDPNQPIFSYASVDLAPSEAQDIIQDIRARYRIQAPELKSSRLSGRSDWLRIASDVAHATAGRALVVALDKKLNLCGKAFEYVFEPVLAPRSGLFYAHGFHNFVMNALNAALYKGGNAPDALALELQTFMRSFERADAPTLFGGQDDAFQSGFDAMEHLLSFSRGYADLIAERNDHLRFDTAKWVLDLTSTSLFSILFRGWGLRHDSLRVLCDSSKPLASQAAFFNEFVGRTEPFELVGPNGFFTVRCNLSEPIGFGSSADSPTLQLADLLARITIDAFRHASEPAYDELRAWTVLHCIINVFPDSDTIDSRIPGARANAAVLRELARRADIGDDPLEGIERFYNPTVRSGRRRA